jgi:hypothetical protein
MPTDTPAAAASQLAREIVAQFRMKHCGAWPPDEMALVIDAKLAPVREALQIAGQQLHIAGGDMALARAARKRVGEALASLSPQPPEAPR